MKSLSKRLVNGFLGGLGYEIRRRDPAPHATFPPDFDADVRETIGAVKPYTMTSAERINALCQAVRYIARAGIPGDIVECGVWKGGSMMAAARTLMQAGDAARRLYLFDTFDGMTPAEDRDISVENIPAARMASEESVDGKWCYSPLNEVRDAVLSTGYDASKVVFVRGLVEETIPAQAPENIALLRLDTDWYKSTKHELEHLFPRISNAGVIIIDDYGYWKGCREAVDEYLLKNDVRILLHRIDASGRMGVVAKG